MKRLMLSTIFLCALQAAQGQTGSTLRYWYDADYSTAQSVSLTGNTWSQELDVSDLRDAVHTLHFQVTDAEGVQTPVVSRLFVRLSPQPAPTTYTADGNCYCWFDEDYASRQQKAVGSPFVLDVSSLSEGVHVLHIQACGDASSPVVSRLFVILREKAVEDDKIVRYCYWVNDGSPTTVTSDPAAPTCSVTQLAVAQQPLRSSCFHFQMDAGQPTIYAKNDIRVRFYSSDTHFTDVISQFVDPNVKEAVTDATALATGTTTVDKPAANAIKWYTLTAEAGDSLQFQLSRVATLQLFAPSGNEVYSASSTASIQLGGLHAEETGTFYLALHDVASTKYSTLDLSYDRIDKYAVLRQDISAVGNGGPSTITFYGNGFDELTSVELKQGATTITSVSMENDGKAVAQVKFDFSDTPLGSYDAVFHYGSEDVNVEQCITVEEALPVGVSATVAYAPQFLLSKGNKYDFRVTNLGNMTYYNAPLTLSIYAASENVLTDVVATGCTLGTRTVLIDNTDIEGFPVLVNYVVSPTLRPCFTELLTISVKAAESGQQLHVFLSADGLKPVGGQSKAVASFDPNDIYGYQDANGDKTVRNGLTQVYYTIEFENAPSFATAPAHDVYVTDILSPTLFDLSSFAPTRILIGDKEVTLTDADRERGVVTIDMRPAIYAVAQVEWNIDETTGTASWHISSLHPMTLEPVTDVNDGVLPVNTDGSGQGQLSFDIRLKPDLANGTQVSNQASIVFDENSAIKTPTWVNTIEKLIVGDVNGDGDVTAQDASLILQYVARIIDDSADGFDAEAADVNDDGEVTALDASLVLQYVARIISW